MLGGGELNPHLLVGVHINLAPTTDGNLYARTHKLEDNKESRSHCCAGRKLARLFFPLSLTLALALSPTRGRKLCVKLCMAAVRGNTQGRCAVTHRYCA